MDISNSSQLKQFNIQFPQKIGSAKDIDSWRKDEFKTQYNKLISSYGADLKKASEYTAIPVPLLASIILLRSAGKNDFNFNGHKGLFALTDQQAKAIIAKEMWLNRLTASEETVLANAIGDSAWLNETRKKKKSVTLNDNVLESPSLFNATNTELKKDILFNPQFNIMVGAMFVSQLFDNYQDFSRVILYLASKPFGKNIKLLREKGNFFSDSDFQKIDSNEYGTIKNHAVTDIARFIMPNGVLDAILS